MASNTLPTAIDDLFTLAERNCDGLATHQAAIGILQSLEVTLRAGSLPPAPRRMVLPPFRVASPR